MITNVYKGNSFIHNEWGPEKVFKFVAEQMVKEMVDDKEQEMVRSQCVIWALSGIIRSKNTKRKRAGEASFPKQPYSARIYTGGFYALFSVSYGLNLTGLPNR